MPEIPENIENRVARLERQVDELRMRAGISTRSRVEPTTAAVEPSAPPSYEAPIKPTTRPQPKQDDAEGFFGGRILLGIGALTLLLGVGFFIKYAFDNQWIGPAGRVTMGLLTGIALVFFGDRFYSEAKSLYASVLTGIGGGVLYLSIWGAAEGFHLIPITLGFALMCAATAALIIVAVRRDSEVTAAFAMLGGFITPLLSVTDHPNHLTLLLYLVVLDTTLAFLPINRRWPRIQGVAFFFTQAYLLTTLGGPDLSTGICIAFATVFLALFILQPIRKTLSRVALSGWENVLLVLSAVAYYFALHIELFNTHRHVLTFAIVVLAAAYVGLARMATSRDRGVLAGIALALITGGVAITFSGTTVITLYALEGVLLYWIGLRYDQLIVRVFGYAALALGGLVLIAMPPDSGAPFLNERFAASIAVALGLLAVRATRATVRPDDTSRESIVGFVCEAAGHIVALAAIAIELYNATHGNELSLTLLWILYAIGLFVGGLARRSAFLRWESLALISLALLKAFAVDLSEVNPGIRIVSFLALGIVLLAIAYAYQRFARHSPKDQP